jgi:hypothetical protein
LTASNFRIEPVGVEWSNRIAQVHAEALPDDILGQLGEGFLSRIYYPLLIETSDVTLGAFADNELIGFVVFSSDRGLYKHLFQVHGLRIAATVIKKCLNPRFVINLLSVMRFMVIRRDPGPTTEFSYMAVDSGHRYGTGLMLFRSGLDHLKRMGIESVWGKTLESTPRNVKLLEALGFQVKAKTAGRVILIKQL